MAVIIYSLDSRYWYRSADLRLCTKDYVLQAQVFHTKDLYTSSEQVVHLNTRAKVAAMSCSLTSMYMYVYLILSGRGPSVISAS